MNITSSKQQMRFSGFRAGLKRRRNGCGRAICIQGKGIGAGWGRGGRGGEGPITTTIYLYLQLDIFFDIETLGVFFVWLDLPCPCQVLAVHATSDSARGQYRERP